MPKPTLTTESGAPVADNQRSQTAGPTGPCSCPGPAPAREAGPLQPGAHPRAGGPRQRLGRLRHVRGDRRRHPVDPGPVPRCRWASRPRRSCGSPRWPVDGARPMPCVTRGASPSSSTPRTATTTWWATTRRSSSSATRSSSPTSSTPRSPIPSPTTRSPTTSGTSSPTRPRPPTCSPGCSATGASRPPTATWTASAPTPTSGSTPRVRRCGSRYHFKTDQGIGRLDSSEAAELAGLNPDSHQLDLVEAIERGDYPSWTVSVQIMPRKRPPPTGSTPST